MRKPLFLTEDPKQPGAAQRVIPSSLSRHVKTWELFISIIVLKKKIKKKFKLGMQVSEHYQNNPLNYGRNYWSWDGG